MGKQVCDTGIVYLLQLLCKNFKYWENKDRNVGEIFMGNVLWDSIGKAWNDSNSILVSPFY